MTGGNGSFCGRALLVLVLVGFIVSGTSQLIEPNTGTSGDVFNTGASGFNTGVSGFNTGASGFNTGASGNGFSFLTHYHYMQFMDMLFTERRLRRILEQNVTRLQNKIDSLNLSDKNQPTGAGISEYLKPLTDRLDKQEQELVFLHKTYATDIKNKNNEIIKLKERVDQLEQRSVVNTRIGSTMKPEVVMRNTGNGLQAHELQTVIKDVQNLKASDIARSEYLIALYKMTVALKQDIDAISLQLDKVFNDSALEMKMEKIGKQFAELQQNVQNITQEPQNKQKDLIIGTGVTQLHNMITDLKKSQKMYNDSVITRRVDNLEHKMTHFTNATLKEFQNDKERDIAVDKRFKKLENSNNFKTTINGMIQRITNLESSLATLDKSLYSSSLKLNATLFKDSQLDKEIQNLKDKIFDIRNMKSRQFKQHDDKLLELDKKTDKCKDEIENITSRQNRNTARIREMSKNISALSADKKHVGFTACGGTKIYDHMHFDEIKTSYGIDMSTSYIDGKFMARDGGYYFVTASVLSGSQDGFYIWKNNQPLTSAWFHYSGSSNGYHSASASVFVKMVPGDKISIRGSSTSYIDPASCLTILKI